MFVIDLRTGVVMLMVICPSGTACEQWGLLTGWGPSLRGKISMGRFSKVKCPGKSYVVGNITRSFKSLSSDFVPEWLCRWLCAYVVLWHLSNGVLLTGWLCRWLCACEQWGLLTGWRPTLSERVRLCWYFELNSSGKSYRMGIITTSLKCLW